MRGHYETAKPHMVWRKCEDCGLRIEAKAREPSFECPNCNGLLRTERKEK